MYYFIKSIWFFIYKWNKVKHYDIIFYYPSHFNRGKELSNVFFDPFYEMCKRNDLSYLIIEEPELFKKTKRNKDAVPFDFMLILILILRKLISLKKFESFQHREWYIAKLLKPIFFRKLTFNNYIVLSNSMMGFFRGLNKDAKLYDYQHGVITSDHRGYINFDEKIAEHIVLNNANVMVYGEGFRDVLVRGVSSDYYDRHTYVIGQSLEAQSYEHYGKKCILFSLQFADPNKILNQGMLDKLIYFFEKYKDFFLSNDICILLKHHPRFQHDINPSSLYAFEFTKIYEGSLFEALEESFLHMTFHSTTTFEAASVGVPTLLLKNDFLSPQFFVDDYDYPLGIMDEEKIIKSIDMYLKDENQYDIDARKTYDWYHRFYEPIDEILFVGLMREKE
jgi:hypothetical protein